MTQPAAKQRNADSAPGPSAPDDLAVRIQAMQLGKSLRTEEPALRDQIALAALVGLIIFGVDPKEKAKTARLAYGYADAILAERSKEKKTGATK